MTSTTETKAVRKALTDQLRSTSAHIHTLTKARPGGLCEIHGNKCATASGSLLPTQALHCHYQLVEIAGLSHLSQCFNGITLRQKKTKPMITLVWLNTSLRHLQNIYLSTYQLLNLISQFPTKCSSFTSTISLRGHNTTALSRYKSVFLFWKWVQKPTYKICPSVRRVSGRNEKLSVSRVVPFVVIRIYFTLVSSTTINVKISILMHWVFQFLFFVCGFKW